MMGARFIKFHQLFQKLLVMGGGGGRGEGEGGTPTPPFIL